MLEEELKGIPQIMPSANCACSFYFADKIRPVMNPEDKMILKNCSFFFFFFFPARKWNQGMQPKTAVCFIKHITDI